MKNIFVQNLVVSPFQNSMGILKLFRWVCLLSLGVITLKSFVVTSHAQPVLIAHWDFTDFNLIVDNGAGTLTPGPHLTGVNNYRSWSPNGLQNAWAPENWSLTNVHEPGKYMEFALDLTGYGTIILNFDSSAYLQGPLSWDTEYSVDGINYFDAMCRGATPPRPMIRNQSCGWAWDSVVGQAIRDQPDVRIRIYAFNASATTGPIAIDNIQFVATTTPTAVNLSNLSTTASTNWLRLGLLTFFVLLIATMAFLRKTKNSASSGCDWAS